MIDLIDRQAAIDAIKTWGLIDGLAEVQAIEILADEEKLPSAQPQRTGRWIDHVKDGYVECPFCHSATTCDDNISDLHFCFSCGARMEGNDESD